MIPTVACVLKSGGWRNRSMHVEYLPADVIWLREMVRAHLDRPHRFVCLSDVAVPGVEVIPLQDDLPGWWSKIELFRTFVQTRVLYLDLDTVLVGDITAMARHPLHTPTLTVLRNLSTRAGNRIGSGVMAWSGDYSRIYRRFMEAPVSHMNDCRTSEKWGDQGFIASQVKVRQYFQDVFPDQVVSFKTDLRRGAPGPANRVVCFHGEPRPWAVRAAWIPPHPRHEKARASA